MCEHVEHSISMAGHRVGRHSVLDGWERCEVGKQRKYSPGEKAAFRAAGFEAGRGAPYFATGDWWPTELERQADEAEALVPKLRLAAKAMRREIGGPDA